MACEPNNKKRKAGKQTNISSFFSTKSNCSSSSSTGYGEDSATLFSCASGTQSQNVNIYNESFNVAKAQYENDDIGLYVKIIPSLSDEEKYRVLCNPWTPAGSYNFPVMSQSGHKRTFQLKWLSDFPWLSYSDKDSGAYCRLCVLFGPREAGFGDQNLGAFSAKAFNRYKNAIAEFKEHANREYHKMSVIKAEAFRKTMEGKNQSVSLQIDSNMKKQVDKNRERLVPIVKTILLCGRQNIPLRGHRDDGEIALDSNKREGNFRTLLRFRVDAGDKVLQEHLTDAPKNATFVSKTTQNSLIECCGSIVTEKIVTKVKKGRFFSIMVDETTDVSTQEQLSFCVRYLDTENTVLCEDFLGFVAVNDLTGEGLTETILKMMAEFGLSLNDLRGQCYDGGANMAGKLRGVQSRISKKQPLALYTHCFSHCLNLALSKSCSLQAVRNVMGTIGEICNFVRNSVKRTELLQQIIGKKFPESKVKRLKPLCETRWVERHDSVLLFREMLPAVLEFLEDIISQAEGQPLTSANGMIFAITQFQFLVTLEIIVELLSVTLPLSRQFQDPSIDLSQAYLMAYNSIGIFQKQRQMSTEHFEKLFQRAISLADDLRVDISIPRLNNRQAHRANNQIETADVCTYYRTAVFIPMLDFLVSELSERFSKERHQTILNLQGLIPAFLLRPDSDMERVLKSISVYENDLPSSIHEVKGELLLWCSYWESISLKDRPATAIDSISAARSGYYKYPNIQCLLHLLAVLPATSCTAERSFSTLRRVKTYLRSTMGQDRLNGLVLLHIHRNIDILPEEVIDKFAREHKRRLQLTYM